MEQVTEFLSLLPIEYHYLSIDGDSYIIFYLPYKPYIEEEDKLFIDSYYAAFQKMRDIKIKIVEFLDRSGYTVLDNNYLYKELALMTGSVKRLKNTLTAHPKYGSFFVIEVIRIKGEHNAPLPVKKEEYSLCKSCNLCVKSCPTNTIGESFIRSTCIRELQNTGYIEDDKLAALCGKKILGCNMCQTVCPSNARTKPIIKEDSGLLDIEYMFDASASGKKGMCGYKSLLGDNYIRPVRTLALVINAMTNISSTTRYREIEKLIMHDDERVRLSCKRYLERINDRKRN